jgi:hypothetical protein
MVKSKSSKSVSLGQLASLLYEGFKMLLLYVELTGDWSLFWNPEDFGLFLVQCWSNSLHALFSRVVEYIRSNHINDRLIVAFNCSLHLWTKKCCKEWFNSELFAFDMKLEPSLVRISEEIPYSFNTWLVNFLMIRLLCFSVVMWSHSELRITLWLRFMTKIWVLPFLTEGYLVQRISRHSLPDVFCNGEWLERSFLGPGNFPCSTFQAIYYLNPNIFC